MSYRVGIGPGMAAIGFEPCEPHITCDGCGVVLLIGANGRPPPVWFLDGRAAPKWKLIREGEHLTVRRDYCPRCKGGALP